MVANTSSPKVRKTKVKTPALFKRKRGLHPSPAIAKYGAGVYIATTSLDRHAILLALAARSNDAVLRYASTHHSQFFGPYREELLALLQYVESRRQAECPDTLYLHAFLRLVKFLRVYPLQILRTPVIKIWCGIEGQPYLRIHLTSLMRRRWGV